MKKYTVSTKKAREMREIKRKMTRGKIKVRNRYVNENKQMTRQQQQKIKEFEDLFIM